MIPSRVLVGRQIKILAPAENLGFGQLDADFVVLMFGTDY